MERKARSKVEKLLNIEREVQKKWYENRVFEVNAPYSEEDERKFDGKFFTTFPFPYMNGKLHLGHSFSVSKCEFAVRFNALKGKRCLFPFGFHCTGMPIKVCADKLQREVETYGYPPKFPESSTYDEQPKSKVTEVSFEVNKAKAKRSKALAKGSGVKYQWEIMKSMGFNEKEILEFCKTDTWLNFFPSLAMEDLKNFGLHVDWRRSFITTDVNPYFNSFVQWQFTKLYEAKKIKFGKRYTIYSSKDGQPCMDHDRSSGEGVAPQEYTLIKLKLIAPYTQALSDFCAVDQPIYLAAATLRPETMYGQTNCWIHPDIEYICFNSREGYLISTLRAAQNMSHQGFTKHFGRIGPYIRIMGEDLIGTFVTAPFRDQPICVFPMLTVKENKGTGIVTSVPSDSPDDYINLLMLKRNPSILESYGISTNTIVQCREIPVINVPELGNSCAVTACENFGVDKPTDTDKLLQAKEMAYTKGFYEGIMIVGKCCGQKVQDAKKIIRQQLLDESYAAVYYEPEKPVISRSGEECVVALCDQWYLDYGEPSWKTLAKDCLNRLDTYHDEVKRNFVTTLDWLHEYACARSYGLGTKLPWDTQWLIESLSDSTIYMAYYTVAHFLENQNSNSPNFIRPEYMTREVWDFIFNLGPRPTDCKIQRSTLDKMRKEFLYWYPVDIRCSGKDLIQNHLTFFIYNHTAIWPDQIDFWPKGIRANGHLLLNSKKMSKSEGNFLTLNEALLKYSADGTRIALADSGDSIEDANFSEAVADAGVLRLFTLLDWVEQILKRKDNLRKGLANSFQDKVFVNEINLKIKETEENYRRMLFKEALKTGFYEMQNIRDKYRDMTLHIDMHWQPLQKYIITQALLLYPICPHTSEYILSIVKAAGLNVEKKWPKHDEVDFDLLKSSEYLMNTAHAFRIKLKNLKQPGKKSKEPRLQIAGFKAIIYVAKSFPPWQASILNELRSMYSKNGDKFPENKDIAAQLMKVKELSKYSKRVMPFVQYIKDKFASSGISALDLKSDINEIAVLTENKKYLMDTLDVEEIIFSYTDEDGVAENIRQETSPYSPFLKLEPAAVRIKIVVNPDPEKVANSENVTIRDGMKLGDIRGTLHLSSEIKFLRCIQPINTSLFEPLPLSDNAIFHINASQEKLVLSENSKVYEVSCGLGYFLKSQD